MALDTSIVVSAIRSDAGASRFLVSAALRRSFELLISVPLALEYEAVMHRPEHLSASGLTHEEVEIVLGSLLSVGREISLGKFLRPNLTDPGDEPILNLALRGAADGLVTQNLRHFLNLQQKFGVKLYSPQEAIRLLRKIRMAQLNEIRLDPSTLAQLQAFASARHLESAELANEALIAGLAAIEERLFWEDRRRGANVPKALEILRNAGKDNSPDSGDELPDNLKCLLDEHER